MTAIQLNSSIPLGLPVPPHTPHAISVSLPTWSETVAYKEGIKHINDALLNGYPRMFIQLNVRKLSSLLEQKYGINGERCMLFPTYKVAEQCQLFMQARSVGARIVGLLICPEDKQNNRVIECKEPANLSESTSSASTNLYVVLFPPDMFSIANQFWQHSGQGISSRLTDHCLSILTENAAHANGSSLSPLTFPGNSHVAPEQLDIGHNVDLEGHCGGPLLADAAIAKQVLRQRIAGLLIRYGSYDHQAELCATKKNLQGNQNSRDFADVTENDVYLFPTGMTAIWNAHQLALAVRPTAKSVCFGFPYSDTLKVLQKWGPGCHFFAGGTDSEIDELEIILEQEFARDSTKPPVLALFTEFPSNPLLCSPNLLRLRALADKYDFLLAIDETIGNFVNVEVLPYADILLTSLSKIFSGNANVMGGSLVLNPNGRHYAALKAHIAAHYQDIYYPEDAIHMEWNSRDFEQRIKIIDANAEAICDFLRPHSVAAGATNAVIKEVFYPKYITPENYERCLTKVTNHDLSSSPSNGGGGYGGLFSLTFTSGAASAAFYDALSCFKGPSLGTNFTLACTYTLLAHFKELEWAAQYGVEAGLVRISVGTENTEALLRTIEAALGAAKEAKGL
ncbi:Pyridoxal phosphate-dependent transferase [Amanita muscaria]